VGKEVRERYLAHRERPDNPNDAIERPLFLELAGDLADLDILDLGCGDARFGREALEMGARSYLGIEASQAMVDMARAMLAGTAGRVRHERIEAWRAGGIQADVVSSRLALNHVEDLAPVFRGIREALRPGGRLIVSVEHPVITSSFASLAEGERTAWLVDNYFLTGPRPHRWLGRDVVKYHRTFEDYLDLVQDTGLELVRVRESRPRREHFLDENEYERRLRIPLFLFLVAHKNE
jgi:SAM-dependent methyltransferase